MDADGEGDDADVHGEDTLSTFGEAFRVAAISAPMLWAVPLLMPAGSLTVNCSCWSLWPNLSPSSCAARADSEAGS
jgi:hypothetical protein